MLFHIQEWVDLYIQVLQESKSKEENKNLNWWTSEFSRSLASFSLTTKKQRKQFDC